MSRAVVPIAHRPRRLPEAGRIRTGVKTAKAMKAIDTFRFTSADRQAIDQLAERYGGEVKPWSDSKAAPNQWEVVTESSEIRVVLPPDPLGTSPVYELWSGGGCDRRCDGVTCTTVTTGPDGLENTDIPCICSAKGQLECEVKTRLSVILPDVRFTGVWRLDTKSERAAAEMPGMVELVMQMQEHGLPYAVLALKPETSMRGGKRRNFIVPTLGLPQTIEQLAAGHARLGALPEGDQPERLALGAGSSEEVSGDDPPTSDASPPASDAAPSSDVVADDEDVVDAEIVEGPAGGGSASPVAAGPSAHQPGSDCSLCGQPYGDDPIVKGHGGESRFVHRACRERANPSPMSDAQQRRLFAELRKRRITGPARHRWASEQLGREVSSFKELTSADAAQLIDVLEQEGEG